MNRTPEFWIQMYELYSQRIREVYHTHFKEELKSMFDAFTDNMMSPNSEAFTEIKMINILHDFKLAEPELVYIHKEVYAILNDEVWKFRPWQLVSI
jgi:hypothetical protein